MGVLEAADSCCVRRWKGLVEISFAAGDVSDEEDCVTGVDPESVA